jgi:DNA-binding winged helix-turn-helix (wHTH) protein
MAGDNPREVYRIGDLILDIDARLLTRAGEFLALPPKTFELLHELVRRAPGVVRRQELMDTVWPHEIVNDEALTQRVMLLRRALGDDPRAPRFIASMPRWGYRMVAPVERVTPAPSPPAVQRSTSAPASAPVGQCLPSVVVYGDRQIPLLEGETILGRDATARVHVDSLDVSRRHARIVVSSDGAFLEDLDSKNGTFLRGRRIAGPAKLADGDTIAVGPVLLTFRVVGGGGTTLTNAAAPLEPG